MDQHTNNQKDVSLDNAGLPPPQNTVVEESMPGVKKGNSKNNKKQKKEKEFTPADLADLQEKLDKKDHRFFKILNAKRYTKKASRGIIMERLIVISLILMFLTMSVAYFFSYTYVNSGYGISVIAEELLTKAVSLTEDDNFEQLSVGLKASAIVEMDNITYDWLPPGLDNMGGGSHNGDNYIAYTFYVLNSGEEDLEYMSRLRIKNSTQNVETAIRVKIFRNGVPTVYTHTYDNAIDPEIEQAGVPVELFYAEDVIAYNITPLTVGNYDRYTVVVWLEGEDEDCVNDKFSSELQMVWDVSVVEEDV